MSNGYPISITLPKSCESSSLNLTQCAAATDKRNGTSSGDSGKQLEDVPGGIVQEEDSLNRDQRSEEEGMRHRGGFESGRKMVEVNTKEEPLTQGQYSIRPKFLIDPALTTPARIGRAAKVMAKKPSVMAIGGFLGSSLKMWWISGSLPYRDTSTVGTGSSGFRSTES